MPTSDLFARNLTLLSHLNPGIAQQLPAIHQKHIQVCQIEGERNLQICDGEHAYFLHAPHGAQQEADTWFKSFSLENTDILYLYGIGVGYFYLASLPWLKADPHHRLVFLEDDISVIYFLLETELGTQILQDLQVDIYDISHAEEDPSIIYALVENYMLRSSILGVLPAYQREKSAFFSLLNDRLFFESHEQKQRNKEMASFGALYFINFYSNLLQLPFSYAGQGLMGRFKDVPAIICGAGPSLLKSLSWLKQLHNRALIFGPGSAMNILNAHAIWPHFGVNIDPYPATFHRLITNRAFETPTFYRHRLYYEALSAIHGPRLFLPGGGMYETAKWFEKQLALPSAAFKEGHSVTTAAIDIAYRLGCNPIILVGLDLSFTPGQHYASGIEHHPLFFSELEDKSHLGDPIRVQDQRGHPVFTYWTWIIEAHWIDVFKRDHPDVTLINSTEGGLQLFSVPSLALENVAATHLTQTYDLPSLIHEHIQQAGFIPLSQTHIETCIHTFCASLKRCEQFYQQLLEEVPHLSTWTLALEAKEQELAQEAGFLYFIKQFNDFFLKFHHIEKTTLNRLIDCPDERLRRYKKLTLERYLFLIEAIEIHFKIIENTLKAYSHDASPIPPFSFALPPNAQCRYYASGALYSAQIQDEQLQKATYLYYYPNGALKTELPYQADRLNGTVKLYYPNGQLKRELHFRDNQREGLDRSWYENGCLFTEVQYENNQAKKAYAWLSDGTLGKEITL